MVFYTADDQIAARDKDARYLYVPATGQSFHDGKGTATNDSALRHYVFAMIQTAEYIMRRQHNE